MFMAGQLLLPQFPGAQHGLLIWPPWTIHSSILPHLTSNHTPGHNHLIQILWAPVSHCEVMLNVFIPELPSCFLCIAYLLLIFMLSLFFFLLGFVLLQLFFTLSDLFHVCGLWPCLMIWIYLNINSHCINHFCLPSVTVHIFISNFSLYF